MFEASVAVAKIFSLDGTESLSAPLDDMIGGEVSSTAISVSVVMTPDERTFFCQVNNGTSKAGKRRKSKRRTGERDRRRLEVVLVVVVVPPTSLRLCTANFL